MKRDKDLFTYKEDGVQKYAYRHRYKNQFGKWSEKSKTGFLNENDAYKQLLQVKAQVVEEDFRELDASTLSVARWIDMYIESKRNEWKPNTLTNRLLYAKKHLKPLIGHFKLGKLDRVTYIQAFINPMLETHEPGTVRGIHDFFKQVINAAIDVEILKRNRFTKIQIKTPENPAANFMTAEQLALFLQTMKDDGNRTAYMIAQVLAHTGMRIGEALGLQWKDIDFELGTVTIKRTRDQYGPRTPKTKNSYRTIHLPANTLNELERYKTYCKKVLLRNGEKFKESNFVFISNETGAPYGTTSFRSVLRRMSKKVGFKVRAHTFRHTFATILISKGIDVVAVAAILGNTPKMVLQVYAHVIENRNAELTNIINQAMENSQ